MKVLPLLPVLIVAATTAGADPQSAPAALYAQFCAACHGQDRTPLSGGPYPALFDNPQIAAAGPAYVAVKALRGAGNMYPLCAFASDAEIVALANDLAAANGYPGPPLTLEAVAPLRPAAGDCPVPH